MYLKRMEICGFKSFANRTVLDFDRGITVIVGPNGCGKSNVLDAIRWALGEQSPKSLRGSNMADIIFNGTQSAAASNYSEVTMVFANEDKALDIAYDEVSITRKLFRSGESEYQLNKTPVRLKDIQQLLSSTGIGEGSYSFVAQGTVEGFLAHKPEEKRVIFDEAAGILQFKDRKREVLRKLKEAEDNLLRVEDIITEVGRQRDTLSRQVQRAKKYIELRDELQALEKNIAVLRMQDVRRRIDTLLDELHTFQESEQGYLASIEGLRSSLDDKESFLAQLRAGQEELDRAIIMIGSRIDNGRQRMDVGRQRIAEARSRLENIAAFKEQYGTRRREQEERIATLRRELDDLDRVYEEARRNLEEQQKLVNDAQARLQEETARISGIEEGRRTLEAEKAGVERTLREVQSRGDAARARREHFIQQDERSQEELSEYERRHLELTGRITAKDGELVAERERLSAKEDERLGCQRELEETRSALTDNEKKLVLLSHQRDFLNNLDVSYNELPYEEDAVITFERDLPGVPAVVVARIDTSPQQGSDGKWNVTTRMKAIRSNSEQIAADIDALIARIAQDKQRVETLKSRIQAIASEYGVLVNAVQDKEKEMSRLREAVDNNNEHLGKINDARRQVQLEISESDQRIEMLRVQEEEVAAQCRQKQEALASLAESLETERLLVERLREEISLAEVEKARSNTRLSTIADEKRAKEETIRVFECDLEQMCGQFETLCREENELHERVTRFDEENAGIEAEIIGLNDESSEKKRERDRLREQESVIAFEREEAQRRVQEVESSINDLKQKEYDKKLELQQIRHSEEQICRDLRQLYEIEISADELMTMQAEGDLAQMQEQEDGLIRRLKYIGSVNLDAPREYDELDQRFAFLTTQKQDLLDSRDALKKALLKINKTSRELFLEVFTRIRDEFKVMFEYLFGGGKADVILLDEENVLESGIDIVVQPPGKKLQNVSLLSGGEKTMTAVALIFAIFKVKPSPLCILDEIDAALDEANVDRFDHVLEDFAKVSQFLVVTHNKKTIGTADVMYGVTMQQSGISKIVSVRFTESGEAAVSAEEVSDDACAPAVEPQPDLGAAAADAA